MFSQTKPLPKPNKQKKIVVLKNRRSNRPRIVGNTVAKKTTNYQKRIKPVNNGKVIVENFSPPIWLKTLLFLQKSSSVCCFLIVSAMLFIYGMTVYAPQQWTREFNRLKKLQKDERQIISKDEVLKEQLAKQTHFQGINLVNPDPAKPPIFLPETPVKPLSVDKNKQKSLIHPPEKLTPIAY